MNKLITAYNIRSLRSLARYHVQHTNISSTFKHPSIIFYILGLHPYRLNTQFKEPVNSMTIFLPNFNFKMLLFHCGKLPRGQNTMKKSYRKVNWLIY